MAPTEDCKQLTQDNETGAPQSEYYKLIIHAVAFQVSQPRYISGFPSNARNVRNVKDVTELT